MKLVAFFALLLAVATTIVAARETNAKRLARGLPPLPPARRASNTESAERHKPSYTARGDDNDDDKGGDGYGWKRAVKLARGLLPVPPARRASGTETAKKHKPSKAHHEGKGDDNDDDKKYYRRASGTEAAKKYEPSKAPNNDGDDIKYYAARDSAPVRRALGTEKCHGDVPVQCCSSITMIANPVTGVVARLVGATLPGAEVPIGLGCSPMIGEDDWCYGHAVCCGDDRYDGIIAMDCAPIDG